MRKHDTCPNRSGMEQLATQCHTLSWQAAWSSVGILPDGQDWQEALARMANLPLAHGVQEAAPGGAAVPAGQSSHLR
eukprot:19127-Alexandrium_andersonii.AAC.1